jgi:hypothetical protein
MNRSWRPAPSGVSVSPALRGQTATLERLRVDRQLEEALVHSPDPLHLAEVFPPRSVTKPGIPVVRLRRV